MTSDSGTLGVSRRGSSALASAPAGAAPAIAGTSVVPGKGEAMSCTPPMPLTLWVSPTSLGGKVAAGAGAVEAVTTGAFEAFAPARGATVAGVLHAQRATCRQHGQDQGDAKGLMHGA